MPAEASELLRSVFFSVGRSSFELGWEECVDMALSQLLRTSLAKSSKDAHGKILYKLVFLSPRSESSCSGASL